jgi:hypothetical protein
LDRPELKLGAGTAVRRGLRHPRGWLRRRLSLTDLVASARS